MRKIITYQLKPAIALILLILVGTATGAVIVSHQRINPPAWMPFIGRQEFVLRAQLISAQGVLPGQGQAVTVSGVRVGQIGSVDLVDGAGVDWISKMIQRSATSITDFDGLKYL